MPSSVILGLMNVVFQVRLKGHVLTTWLIDAARGVILRGEGLRDLWVHSAVL
jgi:hypothetical protein